MQPFVKLLLPFVRIYVQRCAAVENISTDSASRGPSAVAELLVEFC